jgi:hypothetical protein
VLTWPNHPVFVRVFGSPTFPTNEMNTSPTRRESNALYTASLFILIALTAVCLAVSAADVIIQALADKNQYGQHDYRNLFVVGGSYVLLVRD